MAWAEVISRRWLDKPPHYNLAEEQSRTKTACMGGVHPDSLFEVALFGIRQAAVRNSRVRR